MSYCIQAKCHTLPFAATCLVNFKLYLSPHQRIFGSNFKLYAVNEKSEKREVVVDLDDHYTGHVFGEEISSVTAHISKQGVMTAFIRTPLETYYIQPVAQLGTKLSATAKSASHVVAFRSSNVKARLAHNSMDYVVAPPMNRSPNQPSNKAVPLGDRPEQSTQGSFSSEKKKSLSGSKHHSGQTHDYGTTGFKDGQNILHEHLKGRRAKDENAACGILLVADYRLYETFGSNIEGIHSQLVFLILTIDEIYRSTEWVTDASGSTIENVGFFIQNIMIHEAPTNDPYNRRGDLEAGPLLDAFNDGHGNGTVWDGYCLAHLFTYTDFEGLLGLANIASPNPGEIGGICSTGFSTSSGSRIIYNTGYTTFVNRGHPLIMEERILVTGHELGHNWGSNHDPATDPECSDMYIMNEYAQDGSQPTHTQFSICSQRRVGQVLLSKGFCFKLLEADFNCGDYVIDEGEECDEGQPSVCCDFNCKLFPGNVCSDINHICCENCMATSTKICRFIAEHSTSCKKDTICRNDSFACPNAEPASVNSSCRNGLCMDDRNGNVVCTHFCAIVGLPSCQCSGDLECLVCCMQDGVCTPYQSANGTVNLASGDDCSVGICSDGLCVEQLQDQSIHLWAVIRKFIINDLGIFMRQNIVGSVLFFTTIAWIPVALSIHCFVDKRSLNRFWKHEKEVIVRSFTRKATNLQYLFHKAEKPLKSSPPVRPRNFRYHPHAQGTSDGKDAVDGMTSPLVSARDADELQVEYLPLPPRYSQPGHVTGLTTYV